jgi:hypothetical protein
MSWIARKLNGQASESQMGLVLTICIIAMSIMSIGLLWQAQIIANQRDDIRWLQNLKLGG